MAVTEYIGMRYVPRFAEPAEWSSTREYEHLTIVLHNGNSFTSKKAVPMGIDIDNPEYWAETGNYNAQIEQYRRETARALQAAQNAQGDIDKLLPKADFSAENTVKKYALNAKAAGLPGVVCSPLEAKLVKEACGADFLTVTPGIRFADGDVGDQVRIMTPEKAKAASDYIVVGRPITAAADPVAAYERCVK